MRALIAFLAIVLCSLFMGQQVEAQTVTWPFGQAEVMDQESLSSDKDLTVTNRMSYQPYQFTADVTLNVPTVQTRPGGFLFLELIDDGSGRTITFGTNLKGTSRTLSAGKTEVACFIHNGDEYILYSVQQVD